MIRGGVATLPVSDLERSVRFYVETLGMKLVEHAPEAGWAVVDAGEGFRVGLDASGPGRGAGAVAIGLCPKEPIAVARAILENRGVVLGEATIAGAGVLRFSDPDGNALYLR